MQSAECLKYYKTTKLPSPIIYQIKSSKASSEIQKVQVIMDSEFIFAQLQNIPTKKYLETIIRFGKVGAVNIPLFHYMIPDMPNIHKALSPFYLILAIFGSLLVVNAGALFSTLGFFQFISELGIFATAIGAVTLIYSAYKRTNREKHW